MRPNFYLMKATVSGALGGLLFGFDTAVIAGAIDALTRLYHLSDTTQGITVFTAVAGTVVGAMSAGAIGQKLGGRETLRITAVFYVISALGCMLAWNWDSLLVFRFLGGLGIGASSVLGPVYITELAPAKWRGRMVGTFQVNVVIGILLAYASNSRSATLHLGGLGVAGAVGRGGDSGSAVPGSAFWDSAQSALVGFEGPHRRSHACSEDDGRSRSRSGIGGYQARAQGKPCCGQ